MISQDDKWTKEVNKEAEKLREEVMDGLQLPNIPLKPMVLLLGGFQGSGKTTVVNSLKNDLGSVVVSGDEIRQRLFDKKYLLSEKFRQIVKATYSKMFKNLFKAGYSVVSDLNATPDRIKRVKKFLKDENLNNYNLLTVYLQTSKKELVRRLNSRKNVSSRYKGTVDAQAVAKVIRNRMKELK